MIETSAWTLGGGIIGAISAIGVAYFKRSKSPIEQYKDLCAKYEGQLALKDITIKEQALELKTVNSDNLKLEQCQAKREVVHIREMSDLQAEKQVLYARLVVAEKTSCFTLCNNRVFDNEAINTFLAQIKIDTNVE